MSTDRKALIRQYKETPRTMGVGQVRNLTTGKVLLIAGRDLPSLLNRNQAQLRLNAHSVKSLQADWNAQGADAFAFEVLDTLAPPADKPDYDPDLTSRRWKRCGSRSFPSSPRDTTGSRSGPDGVRPRHLDQIARGTVSWRSALAAAHRTGGTCSPPKDSSASVPWISSTCIQ
jgi:hypothetical protein